ncbi:MAG: tail fiber domain-containing protein [bacterium]|nr:tail fiber domain-containing protein [bacterium]
MRQFLTLLTVLCLAFTVSPILAGPIADSLAFQGRLTDASDVPVPDGPRDLTISLWTDSVGGTMLHSEVVVVTVSKGLYSTCIGCASSSFFDIFKSQSVYLQVQLAGSPPMTPRTQMRSVPFSVSSSSLHNQGTMPGGSVISAAVSSVGNLAGGGGGAAAASYARLAADSDGDGHDDFVITDSARTDGAHSVMGGDLDGDGIPDVAIASVVRPTTASLAIKTKGTSAQRLSAGGDCDDTDSEIYADCDDDNDGIVDRSAALRITPTTSSLAINSKGTSAKRLRAGGDCDDTDSELYTDCDDDDDGLIDRSAALRITPTTSSLAIKTKGTSAQRLSGGTDCDDLSATNYLDSDDDGDGIPEDEIESSVMPGTCSVAIKTKGTGADANRVVTTTTPDSVVTEQTFEFENSLLMPALMKAKEKANRTKCSNNLRYQSPVTVHEGELAVDSTGSGLNMFSDDDGDGIPESSVKVGSGASLLGGALPGGAVLSARCDIDDDGDAEGEIVSSVVPGTSAVAIKTKGTGADKNRTAASSCDDSSAVDYLDIDDDADGISEAYAVSSVVAGSGGGGGGAASASYAATGRWYTDSDDDGVPEGDIEAIVTPTTNSVAIKTKGTGADANRVVITQTTDTTRASTVTSVDLDGDGLADRSVTMDCDDTDGGITVEGASSAVKIKHKGWDGLIYGRMAIETGGNIEVDFGGNGVGFVSQRFGIGVLSPTNPLEHSSGAHLTAGGVWTNASDENLKENFQPVDGAELLEKIEQLPISEWNYKTESDEIKHIGPTAQDFQATFGVGSDGKSISTIDPSGIALAAIKELKKENTELKKQIEELSGLKNEIEQLKKLLMEKK